MTDMTFRMRKIISIVRTKKKNKHFKYIISIMACGCSKNKSNATVNKVTTPTKPSRPLSEGGRIRRAEKRIIR